MFSKKNNKTIDIKTADAILQNVLKAVDAGPNNIPLEKIEENNRHDYKSDTFLLILTTTILAITVLLPLLFKSADAFVSVDPASSRPLTISSHELSNDEFSLSFVGPVVNLSETYAETAGGAKIAPLEYNRLDNRIVFPVFTEEVNIYIYDVNGQCLHLLFTPHLLSK